MINLFNNENLSIEKRREILNRAIYSQPFFNLIEFEVDAESARRKQYGAKTDVNKDFWLTEVRANFGEVYTETNSFFNISIYTALNGKSIYRYIADSNLPSAFITTECRFNTAYNNQMFEDRQREMMPHLIRNNDKVIANIENISVKAQPTNAKILLAGYYTRENVHLSPNTTQSISESLNRPITYDIFKFETDADGIKTYNLTNDRFARIVLGFGIVDNFSNLDEISDATIRIVDNFRDISWSNQPLPVQFFAPRITSVRDITKYYLPIEYLLEPFATLKFTVDNVRPVGVESNFELVMLTRTV